jgi:uncharacterized membrane protein (DUF106 family)
MSLKSILISNPQVSVIILALLITLVTTLITKKFTNQTRMKEIKDNQKNLQKKLKESKGDTAKMSQINKEMMESSMELMKHSFKPMIYTFIPLLLFFWWVRGVYTDVLAGWIWWYLVSGVVSSIIFRKLFNVV